MASFTNVFQRTCRRGRGDCDDCCCCCCCCDGCGCHGGGCPDRFLRGRSPARLLFIGNSYTNQNSGEDASIPDIVRQLGEKGGRVGGVVAVTRGGAFVVDHLADPLVQTLAFDFDWDAVVIQGQSTEPFLSPPVFAGACAQFAEFLRPGTKLVLLQTWARPASSPQYGDIPRFLLLGGSPATMLAALEHGYGQAAAASGGDERARVAAAGEAFSRVLRPGSPATTSPFAQVAGPPPGDDAGGHPSVYGSYVAALAVFRAIFCDVPREVPESVRPHVTEGDVRAARRAALEIATANPRCPLGPRIGRTTSLPPTPPPGPRRPPTLEKIEEAMAGVAGRKKNGERTAAAWSVAVVLGGEGEDAEARVEAEAARRPLALLRGGFD